LNRHLVSRRVERRLRRRRLDGRLTRRVAQSRLRGGRDGAHQPANHKNEKNKNGFYQLYLDGCLFFKVICFTLRWPCHNKQLLSATKAL
jgi:hypothetical protein